MYKYYSFKRTRTVDKLITIKAISNACGVLPQTIRTWEKRYQVFNPARTEGGQRVYGEEDLIRAK
ncbi:MAG: MerR family transcriptional regulator, partial [Bdellovibrionales bacterium]|nr:MerR family transcriptional regulator [Bdellovibrionales bacterium]